MSKSLPACYPIFELYKPDSVAVVEAFQGGDQQYTQAEVLELVAFFHQQLNHSGLMPGQAVAVMAANNLASLAFFFAALAAGLRLAPLNRQLTAREICQQCEALQAKAVFYDSSLADTMTGLQQLPCFEFQSLTDGKSDAKQNKAGQPGMEATGEALHEALSAGELCFFTSATTGKAKAVLRQQLVMSFSGLLIAWRKKGASFGLDGSGVHLLVGPSYHAAPLLYALFDFLNGATLVIMDKWRLPAVLQVIERYRVTNTHFVPTYFKRTLEVDAKTRDAYDLSSLERVYHGAAPISPKLKKRCIKYFGPVLVEYWGASECGTCCLVDSRQWLENPGTVGKPVLGCELQIRDNDGEVLPAGEQGKVFARFIDNPAPFSYLGEATKTRDTLEDSGWFHLGDIGYLDQQGFLYLSGRESHTIISGGVNIYPAEIEAVLLEHPDVQDVLVYARADADKGEKVAALIQSAEDIPVVEMEAFLQDKLAAYKWPRYWFFCRTMPVNEAGKITRSALQAGKYL